MPAGSWGSSLGNLSKCRFSAFHISLQIPSVGGALETLAHRGFFLIFQPRGERSLATKHSTERAKVSHLGGSETQVRGFQARSVALESAACSAAGASVGGWRVNWALLPSFHVQDTQAQTSSPGD